MPEEPLFQSPAPNIITGFTIAIGSPSSIALQTSNSAKYFDCPYTLLLVAGVQCMDSSIASLSLILPNAATELTKINFFIFCSKHAFTTLAVPSTLDCNIFAAAPGAKETIAAQ